MISLEEILISRYKFLYLKGSKRLLFIIYLAIKKASVSMER